jgi:hypothetical protein
MRKRNEEHNKLKAMIMPAIKKNENYIMRATMTIITIILYVREKNFSNDTKSIPLSGKVPLDKWSKLMTTKTNVTLPLR